MYARINDTVLVGRLIQSASYHILSPPHWNNLKLLKSKYDPPCTDKGTALQHRASPSAWVIFS